MKTPVLQLKKNLRRSLMQGNPWVYKQALSSAVDLKETSLCKVLDNKNQFVCWGMFNPNSPLALRVLSLEKSAPNEKFYENQLLQAHKLRKQLNLECTKCYRLINGEGDGLPGIICDIYSTIAVIQFDGMGPYEFWDHDWLANWLLKNIPIESVYYKPRNENETNDKIWGQKISQDCIEVLENNINFLVDIKRGQKTGFFLDQRDNRNYLRSLSKGGSVLNLFSYSGGFSVYAGLGGASQVTSVDIAQGALELAEKNWLLNDLPYEKHKSICDDVFEFLQAHTQQYNIVICDPPSMAKSEKQKELAIKKYIDTFAAAAKLVTSHGHLVLSSCSSHINFEDFNQIIETSLSRARKRAQVLRMSGQGPDHPYPHACLGLRYLKFVDLIIY